MTARATYPDLDGKTVAVTGGASGIGAAIVEAFHQQGAQVVFFDIAIEEGLALVEKFGASLHFYPLDLTDPDALTATFGQAISDVGPFDVLVNNAAHDDRHDTLTISPDYWRERLAVNLDHVFFASQAVIPGMTERGSGVMVNMSSISWRFGMDGAPAYVTAKAAIEGLTRALARELGPKGIRVNCVLPGFVRTKRQEEKWLTQEAHDTFLRNQCLKRLIEPGEVAAMVVMLSSDVSSAVTSQALVVDAGWV